MSCIFHDRSDNCFVIVNKVGLCTPSRFSFWRTIDANMPWQLLQQRDLVLEEVIAPKRASCDGSGRAVASWLVRCFLWPSFLAMFGVAGRVSTLLLDITIAVCFSRTVCARNLQNVASLSSWLFTCYTACGTVNAAKSGARVQFPWLHSACCRSWCRADVSRRWRRQNLHQWITIVEYIRIAIQFGCIAYILVQNCCHRAKS